MERPDDPVERARHLRDVAEREIDRTSGRSLPVEKSTAISANAAALAQIATVDLLLVLVDELRQARRQDAREARKDRREVKRRGV